MSNTLVYFVPVIDVSWEAFGPLNPAKNYSHTPPVLEECAEQCTKAITLVKELFDGRCAIAVHTGTYCREGFHSDEFLQIWRKSEENGGEILLHTHEEIAARGTRNSDKEHMTRIIMEQYGTLKRAGLNPVGYRGGLYGYAPFLTPLLEKLDIFIDLSAAPLVDRADRTAHWKDSPFSAYYLNRENTEKPVKTEQSRVLEIPLGASGLGEDNTELMYIDYPKASLESVIKIWDIVLERAKIGGTQYIHTLFHSFSMDIPSYVQRYKRFVEYSLQHGGQAVTASQLKHLYDENMEVE
jgi:peptidoglycan/xylan/chitin deacetylase (PgdA/CDA1 family)